MSFRFKLFLSMIFAAATLSGLPRTASAQMHLNGGSAPVGSPCIRCGTTPGQTASDANFLSSGMASDMNSVGNYLGSAITTSTAALGNQLQADTMAEGNLLSAQDQQRANTEKELAIARAQTDAQNSYVIPNQGICAQSLGGAMVGAGAMGAAVSNTPRVVAELQSGNVSPGTAPSITCTSANCYGVSTGHFYGSAGAARKAIDNRPSQTFLSSDSFMPVVQASGKAGLQQMNDFVQAVSDPEPAPVIPAKFANTRTGNDFRAVDREKEAALSLPQSALLRIGIDNLPSISTNVLSSAQTAAGTTLSGSGSSSFTGLLNHDARMENGTPGYVSPNQVVKSYATAFALNPNFYARVPAVAGNAAAYRRYMLMFTAMRLYLDYKSSRELQYLTAITASRDGAATSRRFNRHLESLYTKAVNSREVVKH